MPSLSDKLKALGVKVGAQGLDSPANTPAPKAGDATLAELLGGHPITTPLGDAYVVEQMYPRGAPHGSARLDLRPERKSLCAWCGLPHFTQAPIESFAFLDIETTGLSGGTGTLAFLVGVGRYHDGHFHLAQFFLRDPSDEPGQLAALEAFLAPCQALVTFNGKAFDAPLLRTRYTTHGWRAPLADLAHFDLLHVARRLWKNRLPSRTLGNLEAQILGTLRSGDDIPGWMIPSLYQEYLRSGDAAPLRQVFYHNAMDILSLAALMDHMAALLDDPYTHAAQYGVDVLALARLFEDMGDLDEAARLYLLGLEHNDAAAGLIPRPLLLQALHRLAHIHKGRSEWEACTRLLEQAAAHRQIEACEELAKLYEHSLKDIPTALRWTETALELVEHASARPQDETYLPAYERHRWREAFERRKARLERLYAKRSSPPPAS
jgi:uncharacterized protein YprB with RNaseH-like and TPR domain